MFYESDFSLHFQEKTDILISISAAKRAVEKASLHFMKGKSYGSVEYREFKG